MKEQKTPVKTKRLILTPVTDERLEERVRECGDEALAAAYGEMLRGSRENPAGRLWYVPWEITRREDGIRVGEIGFHGECRDDSVEIGFGMDEVQRGKGYATEAAEAMIAWAFKAENVFFVEAETGEDNAPCLRVLEKLKLERDGMGEEGPRFVRRRPKTNYLAIYMCFGMCIGMLFGMSVFRNLSLGMCCGLAIGVGLGYTLDDKAKKEQAAAEQRRQERNGNQ